MRGRHNKRHCQLSLENNRRKVCGAFYERLGRGDSFVRSIDRRGDCAVDASSIVKGAARSIFWNPKQFNFLQADFPIRLRGAVAPGWFGDHTRAPRSYLIPAEMSVLQG
jgi:hypothetical protein